MSRVDAIKRYAWIISLSTEFFFGKTSDILAAVFSHKKTLFVKENLVSNVLILQISL